MKWFDQAPSNIALIKYMGKVNTTTNIPTNASLSYTLDHLLSFVELEIHDKAFDCWEPFARGENNHFELAQQGQQRFLAHLEFFETKV